MQNETYEEFVAKFKRKPQPKKTTDDCYTPEIVYKAISDWVSNEYDLNACDFVRPFYPGGDYEKFDYENKIVVDNPPFSIIAKIVDFYLANNVKFFLFVPGLFLFQFGNRNVTLIPTDTTITYENGAQVHTSFITNLGNTDIQIYGSKTLYDAVKKANDINLKTKHIKQLPKFHYPNNVITISRIHKISRCVDIKIPRSQLYPKRNLDDQKKSKNKIYGAGFLCSDRIEHEIEDKENKVKEPGIYWELSDSEKEIIKKLNESKEESR